MQSLSVPSSTAEAAAEPLESLPQAPVSQPVTQTIVSQAVIPQTTAAELTSEASLNKSAPLQPLSPSDAAAAAVDEAPDWKLHLKVFTSTFVTIFLAELGDKTQMTTLLMAAESHSPWVVFAGAGAALVATSAIGVWLGCWMAKRVSPRTLERSVGVLLLFVSALLVWDVIWG